jgi:hypothetical protein
MRRARLAVHRGWTNNRPGHSIALKTFQKNVVNRHIAGCPDRTLGLFVAIAAAMIALLAPVPLAVVFVACSNWQGQPADGKGSHGSK